MHRTLKAETLRPPAANARAEHGKFDGWRVEFNHDRPHEAQAGAPWAPKQRGVLPQRLLERGLQGPVQAGNGLYCYPLTVTDNYSRYLLECKALEGTLLEPTKEAFTRLFKRYGLPRRIRTDNGVPFAGQALARLSQLSVWWLKLGILPELIEPGKPQQNGRHERMHKTLKDETTKPPAATAAGQQRKFVSFRRGFNEERPHEALGMDKPAQWYQASPRQMPARLLEMEYPDRFERRYVSANGAISWNKHSVGVSSVLIGEHVGLEPVEDGLWDVYFGVLKLGRLHERHMRIEDHMGRLRRKA